MKTIDVTTIDEDKIIKTVLVHNIKYFEPITYTSKPKIKATIITFIDNTEIHVLESVETIKALINN